jgi:hypothetical protein
LIWLIYTFFVTGRGSSDSSGRGRKSGRGFKRERGGGKERVCFGRGFVFAVAEVVIETHEDKYKLLYG